VRKPGKLVAGKLYFHKSVLDQMDYGIQADVARAVRLAPKGWEWVIARVDVVRGHVALIQSSDWDTAPEPTVGAMVVVRGDEVRQQRGSGMIYHHKWMFVADDYDGFDVEASKERSRLWESLNPPVDKCLIGRRDYWARYVLPRLGTA